MNELIRDGEERWATARRIASDDHPADCSCIRDHLENAFLLGLTEGEERAQQNHRQESDEWHTTLETVTEELGHAEASLEWTRALANERYEIMQTLTARAEVAERLNGDLVAAIRAWEDADGWWDDSDTVRHCGFCTEEGEHAEGCPMVLLVRIESASASPEKGTQP